MIDRKSGPAILPVKNLTLPPPSIYRLSNGIQVYETNMGTQQVVKIELVFDAGRPFEHKQLAARATASMMREGTRRYSAAEIAEQLSLNHVTLRVRMTRLRERLRGSGLLHDWL